jgi:predicted sugar kinase
MDEGKRAILDYFTKEKVKRKLYFNDIQKALPDMKPRDVKKIVNEMVQEGLLTYWSSGSTTLYTLPDKDALAKEEAGMSDEGKK